MPHRSIVRIPKNKNLSKAGNACCLLITYFISLLIFKKYWIIINASVCGLIITFVFTLYCLRFISDSDSDSSLSDNSSSDSDEDSLSSDQEDIIYQAEVVLDLPPANFELSQETLPSAPPLKI